MVGNQGGDGKACRNGNGNGSFHVCGDGWLHRRNLLDVNRSLLPHEYKRYWEHKTKVNDP